MLNDFLSWTWRSKPRSTHPLTSKLLLSVTKINCQLSLNQFAESFRINRKYLDRQVFYKILLIFILLEQETIPRMSNVFIGVALTYVCNFFRPSICLSIRPFATCNLRVHIFFLSTYLLLDWQIELFLLIGWKSANQINDSIWQVSYGFPKKKFSMGAILISS